VISDRGAVGPSLTLAELAATDAGETGAGPGTGAGTGAGAGAGPSVETSAPGTWEKQILSAKRMVLVGRKALRIRNTNGMEVRKKRPRGFKKRSGGFE
jgi:hypothetical protein